MGVVQGAFSQAKADAQVQQAYRKQLAKSNLPRLYEIFRKLDVDCSGDIVLSELRDAPEEALEELSKFVDLEDLDELYFILDHDQDGRLSPTEFLEGVTRIVSSSQSIDTIRTIKHLERQKSAIAELT